MDVRNDVPSIATNRTMLVVAEPKLPFFPLVPSVKVLILTLYEPLVSFAYWEFSDIAFVDGTTKMFVE